MNLKKYVGPDGADGTPTFKTRFAVPSLITTTIESFFPPRRVGAVYRVRHVVYNIRIITDTSIVAGIAAVIPSLFACRSTKLCTRTVSSSYAIPAYTAIKNANANRLIITRIRICINVNGYFHYCSLTKLISTRGKFVPRDFQSNELPIRLIEHAFTNLFVKYSNFCLIIYSDALESWRFRLGTGHVGSLRKNTFSA